MDLRIQHGVGDAQRRQGLAGAVLNNTYEPTGGPWAASEAVKYLLDSSGTRFLDRVLKALIARVGLYPVGSYVLLSTHEIALVLEHRETYPMRPLLAVVIDRTGKPLPALRITDPMLNPQIHIKSSVTPPEIVGPDPLTSPG